MRRMDRIIKTLGPGILFASTAIGVSHLVQSTRAGALYGFGLLWAILLVNIFKYPFFEYGSRYANATGTSLIDGYLSIGKKALWAFMLMTIGTMFFVTAAVGAVTAGFLDNLFGLHQWFGEDSMRYTTIILFLICLLTLAIGRYKLLDAGIKVIGTILVISTLVAFTLVVAKGPINEAYQSSWLDLDTSPAGIAFLIALMGWMPTAVDMSTWNSIWTIERIKQTGYKPSLKETLGDFNLGYIISVLLAVCFVALGAFMLNGSGEVLPDKAHLFASEVVRLYTENIGDWSYPLIAVAGFSIMFGTCIAIFDGYARVAERCVELLTDQNDTNDYSKRNYRITLAVVGVGGFAVIWFFGKSLKSLVDLATSISFLVAPLIAIANFYLVTSSKFPEEARPGPVMRVLSIAGILFLIGFSIYYLVV